MFNIKLFFILFLVCMAIVLLGINFCLFMVAQTTFAKVFVMLAAMLNLIITGYGIKVIVND